ncbi:MAG: OsmC family protein [Flavobacteriales bacterium]
MNTEEHIYKVDLNWIEARKGLLQIDDQTATVEVATPPPFNGGLEGYWSPEHLLTASVSSCFMTTFLAIAENSKLQFTSFSCSAKGILEQVEGKWLMTEIQLFPKVDLADENDREKAVRVFTKSEAACLISNSIKMKVSLHHSTRIENVG